MTEKSRAAFEAWYRSDDTDLTDNAPSIDDIDAHHKYWMFAAWEASRKQAFKEAAAECEAMIMYPGGRCLAPKHDSVWHAAKAIRGLI